MWCLPLWVNFVELLLFVVVVTCVRVGEILGVGDASVSLSLSPLSDIIAGGGENALSEFAIAEARIGFVEFAGGDPTFKALPELLFGICLLASVVVVNVLLFTDNGCCCWGGGEEGDVGGLEEIDPVDWEREKWPLLL